jgi:hypothetical protein
LPRAAFLPRAISTGHNLNSPKVQNCSDHPQRQRWLKAAAEAGCVEAMYEYSLECDDHAEIIHWLRKAAGEEHVPSMYDYAMECNDLEEKKCWLRKAALHGWQAAIDELDALEKLNFRRFSDGF